jgi:Cu-Zn family superoxide dismutase
MTTGVVEFRTLTDGALMISAEIAALSPGSHGFHIHENGDCSAPDGASAGDHFAPDEHPHGAPTASPDQHHSGDLGNIDASGDGIALAGIRNRVLTLTGKHGVVGRAVVVHAGADDLRSQPTGNSGDPVACGVVRVLDGGSP